MEIHLVFQGVLKSFQQCLLHWFKLNFEPQQWASYINLTKTTRGQPLVVSLSDSVYASLGNLGVQVVSSGHFSLKTVPMLQDSRKKLHQHIQNASRHNFTNMKCAGKRNTLITVKHVYIQRAYNELCHISNFESPR